MAIIVYSTPTCPYCHMLKKFLDDKGVQYEDVDVAADPERAQEMIDKSGQMGVPVADINGKIIVGFNQPEVEAALAVAGGTEPVESGEEESGIEEVVESRPGAPQTDAPKPGSAQSSSEAPGEDGGAPEEVIEEVVEPENNQKEDLE